MELRPQQSELRPLPAPARLVEEYFMDVYGLCFRVLGHPHDAEDATQEAFLAIFRDLEALGRADSPRAWVLGVARNTAVSLFRSRRRSAPLVEGAAEAPVVEEPVDRDRLQGALAGLSEDDRHLLHMKFLENRSAEQMASATGRSRGSLATALCRSLQRLRALYQKGTGR